MLTTYQPTFSYLFSLTESILENQALTHTLRESRPYSTECNSAGVSDLPSWLGIVFVIFFSGLSGIIFNYKNFLVTLMCVEAMYLGAVSSFVLYGVTFRDASAAINALLVLIFGACESAIGLGLLVAAYRFAHKIDFISFMLLGG